jgi:hypothetical protein
MFDIPRSCLIDYMTEAKTMLLGIERTIQVGTQLLLICSILKMKRKKKVRRFVNIVGQLDSFDQSSPSSASESISSSDSDEEDDDELLEDS